MELVFYNQSTTFVICFQYVAQSNDVNAVFRRTKDIVNIASLVSLYIV